MTSLISSQFPPLQCHQIFTTFFPFLLFQGTLSPQCKCHMQPPSWFSFEHLLLIMSGHKKLAFQLGGHQQMTTVTFPILSPSLMLLSYLQNLFSFGLNLNYPISPQYKLSVYICPLLICFSTSHGWLTLLFPPLLGTKCPSDQQTSVNKGTAQLKHLVQQSVPILLFVAQHNLLKSLLFVAKDIHAI